LAHLQLSHTFFAPKQAVFDFLASPETIEQQFNGVLTAKWINSETQIKSGAEFLFEMTRFGITQSVRIAVDKYVLGNSLTYRQVAGAFKAFHHTMKFEALTPQSTMVTDLIDYDIPFGLLGQVADDFFVRSDLKSLMGQRLLNAEKFIVPPVKESVTTI
jgi:hypothetical protein